MALSEHEQRLLDELERGLYASDSNFAARVAKNSAKPSASRIVAGAIVAVIGLSLLVFASMIQIIWFGLAGFAVMLGGLVLASSNPNSQTGSQTSGKSSAKPAEKASKNLNDFFQSRWDQRNSD
jgi:hypothetical protein